MYLFLAFLLVPIIEIALFIQVGGLIGLWPTLAIVVLTAVAGTTLVRTQGRLAMGQLQRTFAELDDPTEPLVHGAMILVAGVLLLTPGFFTDAVGFALLIPPVRMAVFRYFRARVSVASFQMGSSTTFSASSGGQPGQDDVIDGEFTEVKPKSDPNGSAIGMGRRPRPPLRSRWQADKQPQTDYQEYFHGRKRCSRSR